MVSHCIAPISTYTCKLLVCLFDVKIEHGCDRMQYIFYFIMSGKIGVSAVNNTIQCYVNWLVVSFTMIFDLPPCRYLLDPDSDSVSCQPRSLLASEVISNFSRFGLTGVRSRLNLIFWAECYEDSMKQLLGLSRMLGLVGNQ